MRVRLETITPKKAKEWLEKYNVANRVMRQGWVRTLAGHIKDNQWRVTGETIVFNKRGELVNGQHRLAACVESGVAIQSLVVRGVDDDVYPWVDQGKSRTNGDHFSRQGIKNYNTIAGAARFIGCYEAGGDWRLKLTPVEADEVIANHKSIHECCDFVRKFKLRGGMSGAMATALLTLMGEKNARQAETFWSQVLGGEGITKTMPTYTVRERMLENLSSIRQMRPYVLAAICIKAWNLTRDGRSCKQLKWTEVEPFPAIK